MIDKSYTLYEETNKKFVYFSGWNLMLSPIPKVSGIFPTQEKAEKLLKRVERGCRKQKESYESQIDYYSKNSMGYSQWMVDRRIKECENNLDRIEREKNTFKIKIVEISYKVM